jgi:hypothetical protein
LQKAETNSTRPLSVRWNLHCRIKPHFRLEKRARIVNGLAQGRKCDLLDIGCWPPDLAGLLQRNITYFGIDIPIPEPAPNLFQLDFDRYDITVGGKRFDIIMGAGVFEYLGVVQNHTLSEIRSLLNANGVLVLTYTNFGHLNEGQENR